MSTYYHWEASIAAAKRNTTLLANHRQHVVPSLEKRLCGLNAMIDDLKRSRIPMVETLAEMTDERALILAALDFYASATVNPDHKPGYSRNYLAYCKAHSRTPEQQSSHDEERWPGGRMCGFILWISQMRRAFFKASPESIMGGDTIGGLNAWVRFLERSAVPLKEA